MAAKSHIPTLFLSLLFSISTTTHSYILVPQPQSQPCKEPVFFFHNILYKGNNRNNATSAIVGAPDWGTRTALAPPFNFGDGRFR
ncbi:unnamed protein product [Coffea canephora]|uniref:Dirigent protein n=1 Tax=Coffea canephora TaxID=49390 RepID=A0A068V7U7_COFCA|nr:unnamed protein product [Coffea canephora]